MIEEAWQSFRCWLGWHYWTWRLDNPKKEFCYRCPATRELPDQRPWM
jgi:hypothetical protein